MAAAEARPILTPHQLKAITNGIWMCGHHADLIDKNTGKRFPVAVLNPALPLGTTELS